MWDLNSLVSHLPFLLDNRHLLPWVTGQWLRSNISIAEMDEQISPSPETQPEN